MYSPSSSVRKRFGHHRCQIGRGAEGRALATCRDGPDHPPCFSFSALFIKKSSQIIFRKFVHQVGRRPARTVYEITSEGRLELAMLRERAIRTVHWDQDPLAVAITFAAQGADREELASWLRARRDVLAITAEQIGAECERLVAKGYMGPLEAGVMRRAQLHAETEVRWHDDFAEILAGLPPGEPADEPSDEPSGRGAARGPEPH